MLKFTSLTAALLLVCLLSTRSAIGQNRNLNTDLPISTWQAPAFWDASSAHRDPLDREKFQAARPTPEAASGTPLSNSMAFVAIVPCRLVDTRGFTGESGAFGPPAMNASETRTIPVLSNTRCNIPSTAQAYSLNFTVVPTGSLSFLTAWPTGNPPSPTVSILNDLLGTLLANAAVVPAGTSGSIDVFVTDTTQVIIDINGYYAPQISLANGTAAAPSLTFAGDNTSGLYSSGAGTVNVATAGANRLTVAANGNVGIGTTTPGSTLDVAGDINLKGGLWFLGSPFLQMPGGIFSGNIALGTSALQNTTGLGNTAVGNQALNHNSTGWNNTAVGNDALALNTTGGLNTAVGAGALEVNTTGAQNTAAGISALTNNTTGSLNTAVGETALNQNTSGNDNTAVGAQSLVANTVGYGNTALGVNALQLNSSGNENTAAGEGALTENTTGHYNTAIGRGALLGNSTGTDNIAVGSGAASGVSGGNSNNIHIGNDGASADNATIRIGTPGTQTSFFAAGIRGITTANNDAIPVIIDSAGQLGTISSSRRFKEDIQDMGDASSGLLRLRPVTFRYQKTFADGSKPIQYGLIAEEVAEVYPDLVARSADGQIETVKYQVLDSLLLNEVQRQQMEIGAQKSDLSAQKEQIRGLEQQNQDLQRRLARLEAALVSASGQPRLPEWRRGFLQPASALCRIDPRTI